MGLLVGGHWRDQWYENRDGRFERQDALFRNWVTTDGAPGPTGEGGFAAEPGRYHLYVSLACPWAHRTLILRRLKGLEPIVGLSVTHWLMGEQGWSFAPGEGVIADPVRDARFLHELYVASTPDYTSRVTVPVLWDLARNRIVSNESADIARMFNSAFDRVGVLDGDYAPAALLPEIDAINALVYRTVNNGVYRAGFASTQSAYEEAVSALFDTLDLLEQRLSRQGFLVGNQLTEADIRLFATLVRFDLAYHGHFKCNLRRLVDYPALWDFTRDLYQWPGVSGTVDAGHIKRHYYLSHPDTDPTGIVPIGPAIDFNRSVTRP